VIELTLEKAIELIRECVRERGENYVYSNPTRGSANCENWHTTATVDEPGCIIGLAMFKFVGPAVKNYPVGVSTILLDELEIQATPTVLHFLWAVQSAQDEKTPWGEAFKGGLLALKFGHTHH